MDTRKKIGIILCVIIALIGAFYLSGFIFLLLNNFSMLQAIDRWTPSLILDGLTNHWPETYQAIGLSIAVMGCIPLLIWLVTLNRQTQKTHGNATFAPLSALVKAGLIAKDAHSAVNGIIVGKLNNKLLTFGGSQFVGLGAPTRSGKGVGIVIPNLLNWAQSVVVLDIKQECFDITSTYRKDILKQDVFLFNPFSYRTHRYNPLGAEYLDMNAPSADGNLSDIARILYPESGQDPFWNMNAQSLFIGLCFLAHELTIPLNLTNIYKLAQGYQGESLEALMKRKQKELSSRCLDRLGPYLEMPDQTRGSVRSSFETPLAMFLSDEVASATACNDFNFNNLRKKPTTIYIGITPDKLNSAGLLINLFLSQCISQNIRELPQSNAQLKYKCLLLMDEFTAIGTMEVVRKSCSFIAGYGLRLLTIFQSKSQLQDAPPKGYGREGALTLLTNHALQIYYAPREQDDAESLSKALGNTTLKVINKSYSQGGISRSESEQQRPLMLPQEVKEIGQWKEIILLENCAPILCDKIKYFADALFINRLKQVAPSLRNIKGIPNQQQLERAFQNKETGIVVQEVASVVVLNKVTESNNKNDGTDKIDKAGSLFDFATQMTDE